MNSYKFKDCDQTLMSRIPRAKEVIAKLKREWIKVNQEEYDKWLNLIDNSLDQAIYQQKQSNSLDEHRVWVGHLYATIRVPEILMRNTETFHHIREHYEERGWKFSDLNLAGPYITKFTIHS